ncbi:hypothetical protein ACIEGK_27830 [Citrobacter freundii]|uniref:antirestriction phage head protein DarA n=1 Tax=Citrobacter freundii complex TaxID=1344959 RepID=UPI002111726E|nr:hypothetical protein [Citrobacter portucalensis]MCQ6311673.1 hypothetical protein [Citrobacter portucalensis]
MLKTINHHSGLTLSNRQDLPAIHISEQAVQQLYAGDGEHFMLESLSLEEFTSTYFYDVPMLPEEDLMLEAITSTRSRLAATMRAFVRALNQSLNGTGITAGNDSAGEVEDGTKSIGGANIGRARKVQGIAVMPAQIPLSDGQSITLIFHSPSGNVGTITTTDTLVAFRFLLNKRDVTNVVSPANGRDISLKQVTMALSNLIERNTAKFQKAQARQAEVKSEIANLQEQGDKLEQQQLALVESGDEIKAGLSNLSQQLNSLNAQAVEQEDLNDELRKQIEIAEAEAEARKQKPIPPVDNEPSPFVVAAGAIAARTGHTEDQVTHWAETKGFSSAELVELSEKLSAHPTTRNIEKMKSAIDFGEDIPTILESEPDAPPPEADTEAQKAIAYLNSIAELESSDLVVIRNARGSVREAISALTAAGIYDENEELVNAAVQHLSDLLANIAQGGAAA